jgi:hypothetical protein
VAQIVEAARLVQAGGDERLPVAAQDGGLAERTARRGISEHELLLGRIPGGTDVSYER